ncbi:MAG: gliding motility-associated C-terminal domain-containing protein [Flavobacterium sp. JAD_PAG50586_2]|nr:MAG: gliding motility-associated C-terminal domain-containing protein [Flavobacterium sp. JAD_PAG50586_2]
MFGKKLYLFLTFLFITHFAQAQLSNFNLTVTKTDETCTANGTLTFTVSNTTSGATMLYSIFLLPNTTTPISVQSGTTISGLVAGNYSVVATQSLGNQSGTQQQNISIINLINPLTYQLTSTNELCGNDGTIAVSVTNGTAVNYEIISGPMTRPLQTSNVFTGLTAGVYQVRVFDNCGQGIVRTYTLFRSDTALNVSLVPPSMASCNTATIGFNFLPASSSGVVKYPIQVVATVTPPSGPSTTYNQTLLSGSGFTQLISYTPNQLYTYSFVITDGCGRVYNLSGTVQLSQPGGSSYGLATQDCVFQLLNFSNVSSLLMTSAPAGYVGALPQSFTAAIVNSAVAVRNLVPGTYVFTATDLCGNSQTITVVVPPNQNSGNPPFSTVANQTCIDATVFIYEIQQLIMSSAPAAYTVHTLPHNYTSIINSANYAAFVNLPIGTYIFNVVDRCGNPQTVSVIITPQSAGPTVSILEGCDDGLGSLQISGNLVTISLVSAPAAYSGTVPANLTGSVIGNGTRLILSSLPPGNYVFQSTNSCNGSFTNNVTISGYQQSTNVMLTPNCGSFNFNLNHSSNNNSNASFWLQKYDPINNVWGHPLTNVVYTDGTLPTTANSYQITNNLNLFNLAFIGHFRILKVFRTYSTAQPTPISCFRAIYEFDFSDAPRIVDVYSVSCGSSYEVIVNALGNSTLTYRIITKDGQPFVVQNGSSSLFTGLAPGTYVFEVEDACQNSVNSQFQVSSPNPVTITASPILCDGDNAFLTVPNFSFLTYQWWKDGNPSAILSTTNSLNFPSFNAGLNNGIYYVRITYVGNPNSCLNQVLDYQINLSSSIPHAGNDNPVSYCGRQGTIDMATLLTGNFDSPGVWSEITTSGALTNNLWDTSGVAFGVYQFKYTVLGSCATTDEALITVTIKAIPQVPTASVDPIICELEDLNLFASTIPNSTYNWVGPNGFTSTDQNPVISSISASNNGTYTLSASQNGCLSANATVEILVNPKPDFDLMQDCVGKDYQLWFVKLNEASFDAANSSFNWSGPNNFTSNQSPITITGGNLGIYSLEITNQYGCKTSKAIDVARNICFIPNVITPNNDTSNESFNLTGFGVNKLEIYNRWGRMVYEKDDYRDEWHGQNTSGSLLPDGTYYYTIKLSTSEIKTGWIFLSRG